MCAAQRRRVFVAVLTTNRVSILVSLVRNRVCFCSLVLNCVCSFSEERTFFIIIDTTINNKLDFKQFWESGCFNNVHANSFCASLLRTTAPKFTCHVMHRARAPSTKMNNDRADGHCYSFAWI